MNALPIVRRELLVLSRRRWFYWLRSGVGTAIALVSCVVFAMTSNATTYQGLGAPLFTTVTVMSYFLCLLAGPVLLADGIAEEKCAGTLGLLFLTNTRSPDIVGGKFIALAMPALHCLLASLPILAIAFFLRGVTAGEFLRTAAALLNVLLLSLGVAMLCSVLASDGRSAFGASLLGVLICGAGLPALLLLSPASSMAHSWPLEALASSGLALWTSSDAVYAKNPAAFSSALAMGQVMGWACLGAAMLALPFFWWEKPDAPKLESKFYTLIAPGKRRLKEPLTWLAQRRLGGAMPAWVMAVATAVCVGGLTQAALRGQVDGLVVVFSAYALHGVFKLWVGWVSSRAFGPERDSGALELLLITPLGETAIWRAWLAGLRQRFLIPALALIAFDLFVAWKAATNAGDGTMHLSIFFIAMPCALIFLLDCYALSWSGLWSGLIARNAARACIRSMLVLLVIPGVIFMTALLGAAITVTLDEEMTIGLILVWFVAGFILDVIFTVLAMTRLSHDCREAAVRSRSG